MLIQSTYFDLQSDTRHLSEHLNYHFNLFYFCTLLIESCLYIFSSLKRLCYNIDTQFLTIFTINKLFLIELTFQWRFHPRIPVITVNGIAWTHATSSSTRQRKNWFNMLFKKAECETYKKCLLYSLPHWRPAIRELNYHTSPICYLLIYDLTWI